MSRTEYIGIVGGLKTWHVYDDDGKYCGYNQATLDTAPVVPDTITAAQIRKWLRRHDITVQQVLDAIAALPPGVREDTLDEWEYEPTISRASSMLAQLAASFGMDSAAIDAAFIEASTL